MSYIDNKQSLLIQNQFPDFVKEDYPTFIRFMEAYYEFLENKLGTQKNDVNHLAKKFYNIADIDQNLNEFEEYFFRTFLELFPRNTLASKSLLIKNSIPLYLSKGNEKSIKYFFRALFNEEVDVKVPRNDVLIASGGNWKISKVVRCLPQVYAKYVAGNSKFNGAASNTTFYLPQEATVEDVSVYIDGVLQTVNFWQLDNAIYTGKKFDLPYNLPRQIKFKPDGTELFVLDDTTNIIYKHSVSDAWNIQSVSTSAIQQSPALTTFGMTTAVIGLDIRPDGNRLYFGQYTDGNNRIIECQFQDAWNLQTLSSQFTYNVNVTSILATALPSVNPTNGLRDVKFDTTGSNVYVLNAITFSVYQFNLGTPWQVNTATYFGRAVTTGETLPTGIRFKPDGSLFYLTGTTTDNIRSFNMSNAWNIVSATAGTTFTPSVGEETSYMLDVKPEGDILYYGGTDTDDIFQYDLPPDYFIQKEYKKLVFPRPVSNGSIITVFYNSFDPELLKNRKITGNTSSASGIVESVFAYNSDGTDILEFEISDKNSIVDFINGEDFRTDVLAADENPIELFLSGYSGLKTIQIVDEGASYNVGDPIILIGGQFEREANAAVSKVFSGVLNRFIVNNGGAGFKAGDSIAAYDTRLFSVGSITANVGAFVNIPGTSDPARFDLTTPLTFVGGTPLNNDSNYQAAAQIYISRVSTTSGLRPGVANVIANVVITRAGVYTVPPTGVQSFTSATSPTGGAIFQLTTTPARTTANGAIVSVETSGITTPNSYVYNSDLIYDLTFTAINAVNYKNPLAFLSSSVAAPNSTTRLIDAFTFSSFTNLGSIDNAIVLDSNLNSPNLIFHYTDVSSANIQINAGKFWPAATDNVRYNFYISTMGSIGKVDILNKGTNYRVGDKIKFVPVLGKTLGFGCRAAVTEVDASGGITKVEFQPFPPTGNCLNVSVISGRNTVTGNASTFTVDGFSVGKEIIVFNQRRTISQVVSDTVINVTSNFTSTKQNTEIGLYNAIPIGGQGYENSSLPTVEVESTTGTGAVLAVSALMGDNENLTLATTKKAGGIEEIQIIDKGLGYRAEPLVLMTGYGDGKANLQAVINDSYFEYDGRYLNNDSLLSSEKKLQDSIMFNTGSYVIKTKQQFVKYKEAFLKLLHPSGTVVFNEYSPEESNVFSKIISDSEILTEVQITTP